MEYINIYLEERRCEGIAWISLAHKRKNSGLLQKISCLAKEFPAFQAHYSMDSVSLLVTFYKKIYIQYTDKAKTIRTLTIPMARPLPTAFIG